MQLTHLTQNANIHTEDSLDNQTGKQQYDNDDYPAVVLFMRLKAGHFILPRAPLRWKKENNHVKVNDFF